MSRLQRQDTRMTLLIVIAPFTAREGNLESIAGWRERAGSVGGVRAGRVLQPIEIEHEFAGLCETLVGECGIEKAAGAVGRGLARRIAHDEKEFGGFLISCFFNYRLKAIALAGQSKLRDAWHRLRVMCADQSSEYSGPRWVVWDPARGDPIFRVGRKPLQSVKALERRRICVPDAQAITVAAMKDVHVQRTDSKARIVLVSVGIGVQSLRRGWPARD